MNTQSQGLTTLEAARRLQESGPNEVVPTRLFSNLSQLKKILLDPQGLMLLGLGGLYAILGDRSNSTILFIAYIPVVAVDVILELRASTALRSLRATLNPLAKIIRDGQIQDIPIKKIVPGDVIVFVEGQSLPADGSVLEDADRRAVING